MTEKTRDRKPTRARASSRALPRGPHIELYLEGPPARDWDPAADSVGGLDRRAVLAALDRHATWMHPVSRGDEEWLDDTGRFRLLIGDDRVLFRLQLLEETQEDLARALDRIFDLAFDLAADLRLDLVDPLLGMTHTRYRYENQFPRILEAYASRAKTELGLLRRGAWEELSRETEPVVLPTEAPSFEADPESLPTFVWTRRVRRVGPLELRGDRALAAFARVLPTQPWVAITARNARPGDDVALLRVLRLSRPVPGTVVIEAVSVGLTPSTSMDLAVGTVRF